MAILQACQTTLRGRIEFGVRLEAFDNTSQVALAHGLGRVVFIRRPRFTAASGVSRDCGDQGSTPLRLRLLLDIDHHVWKQIVDVEEREDGAVDGVEEG